MNERKDFKIQTYSVEKILTPLKKCVYTLSSNAVSVMKKGISKDTAYMCDGIKSAISNFVSIGGEIANVHQEMSSDLNLLLDQVNQDGENLCETAMMYSHDPYSNLKRQNMVKYANDLLESVTRLLIICDSVDVNFLINSLKSYESAVDNLWKVTNEKDVDVRYKELSNSLKILKSCTLQRERDIKDYEARDEISAANATIFRTYPMLLTSIKTFVRHQDVNAAKINTDFTFRQVKKAINTISKVVLGEEHVGEWLRDNAIYQSHVYRVIEAFNYKMYDEFEENLGNQDWVSSMKNGCEGILSLCTALNENINSDADIVDSIHELCGDTRDFLDDFFKLHSDIYKNMSIQKDGDVSGGIRIKLENKLSHVMATTENLLHHLKQISVDYVSRYIYDLDIPYTLINQEALKGNETGVKDLAGMLTVHSQRLVNLAKLLCSISCNRNKDIYKTIRKMQKICNVISTYTPQLIYSATVVSLHPDCNATKQNLKFHYQSIINELSQYSLLVGIIFGIDDNLTVTETFVLDDVNKCVYALKTKDVNLFKRCSMNAQIRAKSIGNAVIEDMKSSRNANMTEKVNESVEILLERTIPFFSDKVFYCQKLFQKIEEINENEENGFIEASRLLYDGIHDLRCSVLQSQGIKFSESVESKNYEAIKETEDCQLYQDQNDSNEKPVASTNHYAEPMWATATNDDERQRYQVEAKDFNIEKRKFENEVNKWDDSANDLIRLAKIMCVIFMDMSDFTRGKGPLTTTMCVINAAKDISVTGKQLNSLCQDIAKLCPDTETKKDLISYMQRIDLYCHQLDITSRVKADVQNIDGDVILAGLDSATSLLQSSKNLMNAVIMAVRSSYVASTKYSRLFEGKGSIITWNMKPPKKKPLFRRESEIQSYKLTTAAPKKRIEVIQALNEFQH
ncbi:Alpha N-catenin [Intoshia linei]|uniref:Alpha N-catenin n=1 Tax=Intoshia linei TaxID=1819745 RepID=A0A177B6S6_9BILA|nr:Alpha N-catenin [Intoshia linei]